MNTWTHTIKFYFFFLLLPASVIWIDISSILCVFPRCFSGITGITWLSWDAVRLNYSNNNKTFNLCDTFQQNYQSPFTHQLIIEICAMRNNVLEELGPIHITCKELALHNWQKSLQPCRNESFIIPLVAKSFCGCSVSQVL